MRQMLAYTPSLSMNLSMRPNLRSLGNLNRENMSELLFRLSPTASAASSKGKEASTQKSLRLPPRLSEVGNEELKAEDFKALMESYKQALLFLAKENYDSVAAGTARKNDGRNEEDPEEIEAKERIGIDI